MTKDTHEVRVTHVFILIGYLMENISTYCCL